MKRLLILILALALMAGTAWAVRAAVDALELPWWTVDGGGDRSTGGQYTLSGTIGQPDAGPLMSEGSYTLWGGFWDPRPGTPVIPQPAVFLPLVVR